MDKPQWIEELQGALVKFGPEVKTEWFGGRLAELREAAGLSQQLLATKSGLTAGAIAQLEQGRRKPGWATVLQLCRALCCTPNDFCVPPKTAAEYQPEKKKKRR